jgi:hypothetical protein
VDPTPAADPDAHLIDLWPEHDIPLLIFRAMLTQWRMGPGGPVGIDYNCLPWVAQQLRIKPRVLRAAFCDLQVMEDEALLLFMEQRER